MRVSDFVYLTPSSKRIAGKGLQAGRASKLDGLGGGSMFEGVDRYSSQQGEDSKRSYLVTNRGMYFLAVILKILSG